MIGQRARVTVAAALAALLGASALAAEEAEGPSLQELAWMAGYWSSDDDGERMEECWLPPDGDMMLGVHRDIGASGKTGFEYLRIVASEEGVVYLASPGGRPATPFTLVQSDGERAVFENLEHDFPQRIIYWRQGEVLHARIEGEMEGALGGMEWSWERAELSPR